MINIEIQRAFEPDVSAPNFSPEIATVAEVMANGIRLIFDGTSVSDGKIYPCSACANFKTGDRVKIAKINGTYLVEYPIGKPNSR